MAGQGPLRTVQRTIAEPAGRHGLRLGVLDSAVPLVDNQGRSYISGADFGEVVLDEVEQPRHHRERFGVAY